MDAFLEQESLVWSPGGVGTLTLSGSIEIATWESQTPKTYLSVYNKLKIEIIFEIFPPSPLIFPIFNNANYSQNDDYAIDDEIDRWILQMFLVIPEKGF